MKTPESLAPDLNPSVTFDLRFMLHDVSRGIEANAFIDEWYWAEDHRRISADVFGFFLRDAEPNVELYVFDVELVHIEAKPLSILGHSIHTHRDKDRT